MTSAPPSLVSRINRTAWLFVLASAAGLRIIGIGFGLPGIFHQDEPIIVNHAFAAAANWGNPGFFVIPGLTIYVTAAGFGMYYAGLLFTGAAGAPEDLLSRYLTDPTVFLLIGRFLTGVLPGVLTVAVVLRAASSMAGSAAGLTAGLVIAIAPLAVQHSHYLYADTLTTLFLTVYLMAVMGLSVSGRRKWVWVAGLAMGLAIASKYNAVFYAPAALTSVLIGVRGVRSRVLTALTMALAAIIAFAAASPFTLIDHVSALPQILRQSGATVAPGWLHHLEHSLWHGTHPLIVIAAALGLAGLLRTRRSIGIVLLVYFISGLISLAGFSQHFGRYALPLVPAAAVAVGGCWSWDRARRHGIWTAVLLTAAIGWMSIPTAHYLRLLSHPDTRTICREWILSEVPPGTAIARDHTFFAPPLDQDPEEVLKAVPQGDALRAAKARELARINSGRLTYRVHTLRAREGGIEPVFMGQRPWVRPDLESLRHAGIRWVIFNGSDTLPEYEALRRELLERSAPAAVFSPFSDPARRRSSDRFESTAAPLERAALRERICLGPYMEVYRIDGAEAGRE